MQTHPPKIRRARPLLVAVAGLTLALPGCGGDTGGTPDLTGHCGNAAICPDGRDLSMPDLSPPPDLSPGVTGCGDAAVCADGG